MKTIAYICENIILMKKSLSILIVLSLIAYEANSQEAFRHLSAGVEVGTTGAGIELALPVISKHVVVKAGYNLPSVSYAFSSNLDMDFLNDKIAEINGRLSNVGAPERIGTEFHDLQAELIPKLHLSSAKLMLEIYPSKKSSFHFVAGAYMGMGEKLVELEVNTGSRFWGEFKSVQKEAELLDARYGSGTIDDPKFNISDKTYEIKEKNGAGSISASLSVQKVRPYLGIGFGRSIPDGHFGFQFDLGAWIHGTPELSVDNNVPYDPSVGNLIIDEYVEKLKGISFYPQVSLRLIYKIF